ncbi:multiubiquitin domain-containing protein [Acetobacter fabarum]|uniref:multiubiquitin domain-containing protein n=1 Tax=Acetobacter fabarum TaxID=483199 RepID=UPI0039E76B09
MNDEPKPEKSDRIERDAEDIVEAGRELAEARERELKISEEESLIDAELVELQRRKAELEQKKREVQETEVKEEQRIAEDLCDIQNNHGQNGNGGSPGPCKDEVTITINTVDFEEPKGTISYQRVVELAYPDFASFPKATYSIMYERGPKANLQGVLSKGGSVKIDEGMRFRVKRTGES